ncbi:MAG: methionyl-tRNA formyltransferase [Treponema sp.]|jgi:methionyl-tRNA formyltransferase|nr:methionyl-tRNA formyltransferase [Treponema sp.]
MTRVLFAGSPGIAVPCLNALAALEEGRPPAIELAGVLTNPDSPRGRRGEREPTEVSAAAAALSEARLNRGLPAIPQIKPEKLGAGAREQVLALKPDLLVSFAYGRIFGPRFLSLFPLGGINIHPSLLPRFRGPSPIPAVILAGDGETGISIQKLAPEMDSGDILVQERFPLGGRETAALLGEDTARRSAVLLGGLLKEIAGDPREVLDRARPQEGEPSYCSLLSKEAGRIDWSRSAAAIDAQIRAYTPWPLSFTQSGGDLLYILEAAPAGGENGAEGSGAAPEAVPGGVLGVDRDRGILVQTGEGILAVSRLQYRARKAMDWKSFLNGARNFTGSRLGGGA